MALVKDRVEQVHIMPVVSIQDEDPVDGDSNYLIKEGFGSLLQGGVALYLGQVEAEVGGQQDGLLVGPAAVAGVRC